MSVVVDLVEVLIRGVVVVGGEAAIKELPIHESWSFLKEYIDIVAMKV